MRKVVLLAAALVGVLLATATSATSASSETGITARTITIGGTFPLTGRASVYAPIPAAMKAYFAYINSRRGPDGRRGIYGRQIVVEHLHCKFLVLEAPGRTSCSVYEERFEKAPWCMPYTLALKMNAYAKDCPYVENGVGKERVPEEEYERLWPRIAEDITARQAVPANFTWAKFFEDAEKRDRGYVWSIRLSMKGDLAKISRRWSWWAYFMSFLKRS